MLNYICLGIAAVLVALDQLVKFWAEHSLSQVDTIALIPGVFHLTYVQNFGAAFNTMNNQRLLLVVLTSAVLLVIFVLLLLGKLRSPWMVVSWSLILAGGAGNLIDRLFLGFVTDMFQTLFMNFPIFNVADICIVTGAVLGVIYYLWIYERFDQKRSERHGDGDPAGQ